MSKLTGKTAVITGGNSGIGLATARLFHQEGAKVIITGRNQTTLDAAAQVGSGIVAIRSDAANLRDITDLFAKVSEYVDKIDILFLNAGIARFVPIQQIDEKLFDEVVDTNFKGLYFSIQQALPLLSEGASIILTTSIANQKGMPTSSVYAASKSAVRSLARTLSAELLERGIRVNAISPGPIETPIFGRTGAPEAASQNMKETMRQLVPLKRLGDPEEIARTALFLASNDSAFIVGSEIVIDGGLSQL